MWLTTEEAGQLSPASAARVDGDAELSGVATTPRDDPRACPQCGQMMSEITGGVIPDGLHVDTCVPCNGLWFDPGELILYKGELQRRTRLHEEQSERHHQTLQKIGLQRATSFELSGGLLRVPTGTPLFMEIMRLTTQRGGG